MKKNAHKENVPEGGQRDETKGNTINEVNSNN